MSLITVEELRTLVEQPQGLCVSIYMPTYKAGPETRQNPIRFKNLIKAAEHQLVENGLTATKAGDFLAPAQADLDREDVWENQDEGLAVFVSETFYRSYKLPRNLKELVVVTDHFHLKPLLPLLTGDGRFYILSLSQKFVRLLECDRHSFREVPIEGLPQSMDDTLQLDATAKTGQFRIATSKGSTSNSFQQPGAFHGQGSPDQDDIKQNLLQFFHQVDDALHEFLRDKQAPLMLAGVEYLMPVYREANTYAHLLPDGITGNPEPETVKPEQLHQEGWQIVEPYFAQAREAAVEHYREMSNTGKSSSDLQETVPAAFYGRVEQLFVAVGVQRWGSFDPMANALEIHSEPQPGDEDLLDAAAIQTLLNGGTVYAVEPENVPDEAPLAAVFRY